MRLFDNISVSIFRPYLKDGVWIPGIKPKQISLTKALTTDWQPVLTARIKSEPDKLKRGPLKLKLFAITPSAVTINGRMDNHIACHTGLLQFDIDDKPEQELNRLKTIISALPFVVYMAISASGTGLWGLVKIKDSSKHGEHYNALRADFKSLGIEIDTKPRAVNSLRFLSYDAGAYYREDGAIFTELLSDIDDKQRFKRGKRKKMRSSNNSVCPDLIQQFNDNCTAEIMYEILENFGFTYHSHNGPNYRFTRPDKDISAGLSVDYHEGRRTLYSFSSNTPGLEHWKEEKKSGWSCSPVTALLLYGFGGFSKANWAKAFAYIKDKT